MKCAKSWLFVVLSRLFVVVFTSSSSSLEDEVQTLKAQINALTLQYQQDYNRFEDTSRRSVNENIEVTNLRNEIGELRLEIDLLRKEQCSNCANGNRLKNEQITVQWLSNTVSELRGEISELARSVNTSAELQQQQTFNTDISIMQNDIVSLRHDVESLKGELAKTGAKLSSLTQDVDVSRQLSQSTAVIVANLTERLQTTISDWTRTVKSFENTKKAKDKVFKRMVVVNNEPLDLQVLTTTNGNTRYRRHRRSYSKGLNDLKQELSSVQSVETYLTREINALDEKLSNGLNAFQTRIRDKLEPRLEIVEKLAKKLNSTIVAAVTRLDGQDELHSSVLELLESVENIETKVDTTMPDLKREISKLEFNLAQITSTTSLLKEDQENQKLSVKALSESLSSIQDKLANYQNRMSNFYSKLNNVTNSLQDEYRKDINDNAIQENATDSKETNLNIENTFQKLSTINSQYSNIVNQLPKDCDSVSGSSGPYLVSPDGDVPILVYCDIRTNPKKIAYTVIQRRINGVQDFNKNWEQYASGFGDPSGEFWLGNEAIHRLTKANDTMARIDFKDISGKPWYAEYSEFNVASRTDGFRLHVAGYNGNASDALAYQNRMQFSTVDSDRDISNTNCAANYEGGWWFSHCQHTNLNGKYNLGLTWFDLSRNEWIAVAYTEIKLRRKT